VQRSALSPVLALVGAPRGHRSGKSQDDDGGHQDHSPVWLPGSHRDEDWRAEPRQTKQTQTQSRPGALGSRVPPRRLGRRRDKCPSVGLFVDDDGQNSSRAPLPVRSLTTTRRARRPAQEHRLSSVRAPDWPSRAIALLPRAPGSAGASQQRDQALPLPGRWEQAPRAAPAAPGVTSLKRHLVGELVLLMSLTATAQPAGVSQRGRGDQSVAACIAVPQQPRRARRETRKGVPHTPVGRAETQGTPRPVGVPAARPFRSPVPRPGG